MTIKDTEQGYSWLSITLHWVTAITVIALYLIAELSEDLPKEQRREWMALHVSIAVSLYLILWGRILWRIAVKRPRLPPQHILLDQLAFWIPLIMLAGITIQLVSGPLIIWSNGSAIDVFGIFSLPSPLAKNHDLHELLEEVHEIGANVILAGFVLHVLGVVKHLVINRENLLAKITLPGHR